MALPHHKYCFTYTLDVLTDGSEYTGDGTLFLSVYRSLSSSSTPRCATSDVVMATQVPVSRYGISGLGDLTSRLACDQRFKLAGVKAVFACSDRGLWGLPSLLLALHHAGSPCVTVVSSRATQASHMIQTLEGKRRNPVVRLCQVPAEDDDRSSSSGFSNWWLVFQDEFVVVHAQIVNNKNQVAYLYTLLRHSEHRNYSILLVPPSYCDSNEESSPLSLESSLPDVANESIKVFCRIALQPRNNDQFSNRCSDVRWFYTRPTIDSVDPGLLVRAQNQAQVWHESLPSHFPWRSASRQEDGMGASCRLHSGTSIVLNSTFTLLDRTAILDVGVATIPAAVTGRFFPLRPFNRSDENEIDLEEDSLRDGCDGDIKLLCLGTGCAAPSPFRGASAYALLLDCDETFVFEVGEGFATQWNRHAVGQKLLSIRCIWISHAHWDHFGGIVPLLTTLYDMRRQETERTDPLNPKRRRVELHVPSLVIASDKVLLFLQGSFDRPQDYYRGVAIRDRETVERELQKATQSLAFLDSVPVHHCCAESYGFILGIRCSRLSLPYIFCYSGDTRPCRVLTKACRSHAERHGKVAIDFLLHEATFASHERDMSVCKMHSTLDEAIAIVQELAPRCSLLTHFSQRYPNEEVSNWDVITNSPCAPACDGLLLHLSPS